MWKTASKMLNWIQGNKRHDAAKRRKSAKRQTLRCESLELRRMFAADANFGMYLDGNWKMSDNPSAAISFGLPGDQPVMGDWNGDGVKTSGIYRNGTWVLDLTGNGYDAADRVLSFGLPGDKAVAGDWDGDGVDTVGVYRGGTWYFDRNGNGYDAADANTVSFGWPTDIPVAGDWDGDGKDTPGVYRAGTWAMDLQGNGFDSSDRFVQFGLPNDQPIAGDWNGDGTDTPGVLQNNHWFFDLEGNGFNGEKGSVNTLGKGIAVAGKGKIVPILLPEVDVVGVGNGQSISLGTVPIGATHVGNFTVRNLGDATLTLGQVQVPSGFSLVVGLPNSLPPNSSATFRIAMDTSSIGTRSGVVQFSTNDADESPYSFHIAGSVREADVPKPEIEIVGIADGQASPINFGTVTVGSSVVREFAVRNLGNAVLTLGQPQVPAGFTLEAGLPNSLAPNASASFRVRMNTSTIGTRSGMINIASNDSDESPYNFSITGKVEVTLPEVDVVGISDEQSTAVSFGSVDVGASAIRDFTVRNLGNAPLTLGQVQVPPGFSLINGLPSSLAPNASATFRVAMNTSVAGTRSGMIQFNNNDADESPFKFPVSGNVIATAPEVDVIGIVDGQSAAVSFGTVNVGATVIKEFTVRNLGNAPLTLGNVQVPSGFTLVTGLPNTLLPNASATFRVRMETASEGSRSGVIQFTNNDKDESPYSFPVSGVVQETVTSVYGTVLSWQRIVNTDGILILKSVQTYGAPGNTVRLYGDFRSLTGQSIRSDVAIGDFGIRGDQMTPMVVALPIGRYAIAWHNTNITTAGGIHYAIFDAYGATIGASDRVANITYQRNYSLQSIRHLGGGSFRITWKIPATNQTFFRDFNSVGVGLSGEMRG